MHHFQTEIVALDLAHHLPSLLAVHLAPLARLWWARTGLVAVNLAFLGLFRWFGFHANLS